MILRLAACIGWIFLTQAVPMKAQVGPRFPPPSESPAAPAEQDPYGRETPSGSFLGFVEAARRGNLETAGQYLQWPVRGVTGSRDELAGHFQEVLDLGFDGRLLGITNSPQGNLEDGLPPGLERIGQLVAGSDRVDVLLVRRETGGKMLWLVSEETLRSVPRLYGRVGFPDLERRLPAQLVRTKILGIALWKVGALLIFVPVAYGVIWTLLTLVLTATRRFRRREAGQIGASDYAAAIRAPLTLLLTLALQYGFSRYLGVPLFVRYWYVRILIPLFFLTFAWLVFRILDAGGRHAAQRIGTPGAPASGKTLGFALRIAKVIVIFLAFLAILASYGVNLTATLAGLGIGGLAVAFAAQKSLENLFGGFTVLGDGAIRLGEFCRIGNHLGTVEDITLMATRVRTLDRTIVTIPNGQIATERIENYARRDKFWFHPIVGLRYETTAAQMERIVRAFEELLLADPRVERESVRVRFLRFGSSSLDVELFAYVRAEDWSGFLAIQEPLLMRMMRVVEEAGSSFAFPSQTLYLGRDRAPSEPEAAAPAPEQEGGRSHGPEIQAPSG